MIAVVGKEKLKHASARLYISSNHIDRCSLGTGSHLVTRNSHMEFRSPGLSFSMAPAYTMLLLTDLVSSYVKQVPYNYIRPLSDRPDLLNVESHATMALIDLQGLGGADRSQVVKEIGLACRNDGFFQVKNHGIPKDVVDGMLRVAKDFFHLPKSERLKIYSQDPTRTTRLSTSFNVKTEKVRSGRDYLRLHCYPLEDFVHEWPSKPSMF